MLIPWEPLHFTQDFFIPSQTKGLYEFMKCDSLSPLEREKEREREREREKGRERMGEGIRGREGKREKGRNYYQ